ncbi:MAG TPA: exodeoxyribonuclease VII large subunit, partial [Nitrococcus sp.]|nr:exodeoxyribonuclease VII large subunit [Nitrococcus sp.]
QSCLARLSHLSARLQWSLRRELTRQSERFGRLERRLANQHPRRRLHERSQRLDELEQRLTRAGRMRLRDLATCKLHLAHRLQRQDPRARIRDRSVRVAALWERLQTALAQDLRGRGQILAGAARALEAISPLKTLGRGYAIIRRERDGHIVRQASEITPGERISARLYSGELLCRVEERREASDVHERLQAQREPGE